MRHIAVPVTASPPLVVDLDGTLCRTDTLWESLFALGHRRPGALIPLFALLVRGRAAFKAALVDAAKPEVASLPLNGELLDWLVEQRSLGRSIVLATASDQHLAYAVAERVGLFDAVLASDGVLNLKGLTKATALVERYNRGGFDYVGDTYADLPVWASARRAIVVGGRSLSAAVARVTEVERRFALPPRALCLLKALRIHQWVKNLLVFLPLVAAHQVRHGPSILSAMLAFLAFSLSASSVYVLNDLLDLSADRVHPRKGRRPFASGTLPLAWGAALVPILFGSGFALSLLFLPTLFTTFLGGYFLLTTAYSLGLKRRAVVDVLLLAALYTLRVIAGAAAVALQPSFWLLGFSMFIFLSLALAKRYTELDGLRTRDESSAAGRGWRVDDLPLVQSLGIGAGIACVLVLALYLDSPTAAALYACPQALWLVCPLLLYWISRIWLKTHRGEMHDDPVVFALRDRVSLVTAVLTAGIVVLARSGIQH